MRRARPCSSCLALSLLGSPGTHCRSLMQRALFFWSLAGVNKESHFFWYKKLPGYCNVKASTSHSDISCLSPTVPTFSQTWSGCWVPGLPNPRRGLLSASHLQWAWSLLQMGFPGVGPSCPFGGSCLQARVCPGACPRTPRLGLCRHLTSPKSAARVPFQKRRALQPVPPLRVISWAGAVSKLGSWRSCERPLAPSPVGVRQPLPLQGG